MSSSSSEDLKTMEEPTARHAQVNVAKHPFCEPWEDSDLIFVVEEEKFHVHRQIMSIHSPVFKAMLNSVGFKEATATEIPLPGKRANEFLDFLQLLYMKNVYEVQLNQLEHLLKLADEYQAGGVVDMCVKMLEGEPKFNNNAVKILHLATSTATVREDERLFEVVEECCGLTEDMELTEIKGKENYKNLEKDALERVLVTRIERLERFVKDIYPQFVNLVEFSLSESLRKNSIRSCPEHFSNSKTEKHLLWRMKVCPLCRLMIKQLICNLEKSQVQLIPPRLPSRLGMPIESECHFDVKLISIILDFKKIIRV